MSDKKLVLVVDDEAVFREIMTVQLEAGGFGVATASTPQEALQKTEQLNPDLVLMDIHIGGGETGTDVALEIRQNEKTKNTRIAFLSNMKDPWPGFVGDNSTVAKEIGMVDFLSKTDDPQVNLEKIKKILAVETEANKV
ncbi:MAG: response regulator [Anaplasmataceae bacterium]|nr:response regulator [Anaplasmataceae bacterium]